MSDIQHLSRDVIAVKIPSGEQITLPADTQVLITQALGGTYTVMVPSQAGLYRIDSKFADALGRDAVEVSPAESGPVTEEAVWAVLKTCYDPEIPVDIVNLGLVYSLKIEPSPDGQGSTVSAELTLTAPGCGMGPVIAREAQEKIEQLNGVTSANVEVVWTPAWTPERITEEGRLKLGIT